MTDKRTEAVARWLWSTGSSTWYEKEIYIPIATALLALLEPVREGGIKAIGPHRGPDCPCDWHVALTALSKIMGEEKP